MFRYTTGAGSYDSIVIEFNNYIMMLEAGQSQVRAAAYVAEIKKQFPGKPIRYVMVTHPHSDHTGGLPVLVAEGATIVVQENSREFFERALNTPRTLLDDALAKAPKRARVESVADKKVYTDGTHTVELYHIYPAPHSNALLVAYLPKEKVLFQGDFSVNPAQGAVACSPRTITCKRSCPQSRSSVSTTRATSTFTLPRLRRPRRMSRRR